MLSSAARLWPLFSCFLYLRVRLRVFVLQRRDFSELYTFSVDALAWSRVDHASGTVPEKRSGHGSCAVRHCMLIYGGWSTSGKCDDCHSFDTETATWAVVDVGATGPRWGHSQLGIAAVPSWQVFVFGGSGPPARDEKDATEDPDAAESVFLATTSVLDMGKRRWTQLTGGGGGGPAPRADAAMAYDPTSSRLIMHGGWANSWLGDIWTMSVASVIGPPYAVTGVAPALGPVTGGTLVTITGIGFEPAGGAANVRFALSSGKKYADAVGTISNATTMTCVFLRPACACLVLTRARARVLARAVYRPQILKALAPRMLTCGFRCVARRSLLRTSHSASMRSRTPAGARGQYSHIERREVTFSRRCHACGPALLDGCIAGHPVHALIQVLRMGGLIMQHRLIPLAGARSDRQGPRHRGRRVVGEGGLLMMEL